MITLTDIAYVRSGVADLETAVRFATDIVGLELATLSEAGVAHLRADHRHHCLALLALLCRLHLAWWRRHRICRRRLKPRTLDYLSRR